MTRVRKIVTLVPALDEDYCQGAALRRRTTSMGKKLSTIDCMGYAVSNRQKIPFLTGDREFEYIEEVEFVL